jgi:hypothetical protein
MLIDNKLVKQILLSIHDSTFQGKFSEKTFILQNKSESDEEYYNIIYNYLDSLINVYKYIDGIGIVIYQSGSIMKITSPRLTLEGEKYLNELNKNWFSKHKNKIIYGLISLIFAPILVGIFLKKYVD